MEDDGGGRSRRYELGGETNAQSQSQSQSAGGLTLGGILSIKQTPPYRINDRTLLDLIRDDQSYGKESKKTWKILREKLRLRLSGSVCTTNLSTAAADSHRVTTTRLQNYAAVSSPPVVEETVEIPVEEIEETTTATAAEEGGGGDPPPPAAAARMSLMSLLEFDGSGYLDDDDEEVAEEEETVAEGGDGGGVGGGGGYKYNYCCVCMVRHKGAAFIPCGHTFCRLCSRELFVQRASCPLCNNFILEILDIF